MEVRNIAIIQLDGPSEILASAAVIHGLRKAHSEANISIVVSPQLVELATFLGADNIISSGDENQAIPSLPKDAAKHVDLLINLSLSEKSCLLANCFQAKNQLGARLGDDKQICLDDGWTRFYKASKISNTPTDIHLVEILSSIAGVQWVDPDHALLQNPTALASAKNLLQAHEHIKIAMVPGTLPDDALVQAIEVIYDCGFQIHFYFVGTLKDRGPTIRILERLGAAKSICTNLTGIASLAELVCLFQLCDIAVGSMGLSAIAASGFGTLKICYMENEMEDYSQLPYGLGHIIIRPETKMDNKLLGDLTAEIIAYAISKNNGAVPTPKHWQEFFDSRIEDCIGKVNAYLTAPHVIPSTEGCRSEPKLVPMLFSGFSPNDLVRTFHRHTWEQILNEAESSEISSDMVQDDAIAQLSPIIKNIETLGTACAFGIRYTNAIRDSIAQGNLPEAQKISNKLPEVDELILSLGNSEDRISTITNYFFINQEQIFDIDPLVVSEKMLLCYTLLSHQAMYVLGLYHDLLRTVTEAGKPTEPMIEKNISGVETNG